MSKVKSRVEVQVKVPEWMRSDVIASRVHDRVQKIVKSLPFNAPDDAMQAIAKAIVEGYVVGYGDGRGMLEYHTESEVPAHRLADLIIAHESEEAEGDMLAIAAFVRRVAGIIEQRGLTTSAPAPKGLPS